MASAGMPRGQPATTPAGRGLDTAVRSASPLLPLDLVARGGEDVPLRAELIEVLPVRIAGLLVAGVGVEGPAVVGHLTLGGAADHPCVHSASSRGLAAGG